jgi:hypothetical protein
LWEEQRLRAFENRTLKVMFGLRLRKEQEVEKVSIVRNLGVRIPLQQLFG